MITLAASSQEVAYQLNLTGVHVLVASIIVLYLGEFITRHVKPLRENSVPTPVTGGLICSIFIALLAGFGFVEVTFDMATRDLLLLTFFSTIGLSAKLKTLAAGGKALGILLVCCTVFLIIQNVTGVLVAMLAGRHPGFGMLGGSVSFAGGHGTAIAWGEEATKAGIEGAAEFGIACATFGLIVGGLIGGPLAGRLIRKHGLDKSCEESKKRCEKKAAEEGAIMSQLTVNDMIGTLLALAICIGLGDSLNQLLFANDVKLPGFLTAMVVGIILTNLADPLKIKFSKQTIDLISGVALQLFLAMSLMSMDLLSLVDTAGLLLVLVVAQMLAVTLFAVSIIFRLMGRDYDAAVIAGGFVGMGLGATPVAIANMSAVTRKYGPSVKAFLIVPLVGAFFIDLANAMIIKFFIGMPFFQRAMADTSAMF